jgi:hypothetical protein
MIDAHEMGAQATYLFSPPREPFNPSISEYNHFWWRIFSRDQAAAFDQHGWEYYTRDWNEEWFPGYGSSWAAGIGAVGILYEQAGVDGSRVARVDGTVMTYRETVHHQITSFLTNFHTAVLHHDELLRSFRGEREKELSAPAGAYVIIAQAQPAREEFLLRALDASGIEVFRLTRDVTIPGLRSYGSDAVAKADVPRGSLVIPERQPFGRLVQALFGFDPQMDDEFLRTERRRLEKEGLTRLYEVTAWSVSLSSGLPVYHAGSAPGKDLEPTAFDFGRAGCVIRPEAGFGFVIDGTDDRCLRALVRLVESGCKVHAARKPFVMEGRPFARGSLLVKRVLQNRLEPVADGGEDALLGVLSRVARETGVTIIGAATALMDEGPDLGSSEFRQIEPPAVGIFAGEGISPNSYGAIAWLLDHETGFGFAALPAGETERLDLDRYNVLILPNASDGPDKYASALGAGGLRKLRAWVRDGGTLIAMGTGAAFVADSTSSLGTVRLRRQVLAELAKRTGRRLAPGKNGETPPVLEFRSDLSEGDFCSDELRWAKAPGRMDGLLEDGVTALRRPEPFWMWAVGKPPDELEAEDARMRLYHPRGAILRVDLDEEHWLSAGCGVFRSASVPACGEEETGRTPRTLPLYGETSPCWMPVQTYGEYAFVASDPADIVGAYAPEDSLRLAGLLWPEARERWARTAYLTRERVGEGQIILFGTAPCQRGAFKAAERAFLNAVLLGPGLGTSREWPWSDARR